MTGSRAVPIPLDHPSFAGHFPGMPIFPGAALLDEALHVVTVDRGIDLRSWQLTTAKFQGAVRPGETPTVEHTESTGGLRFTVRVGDRVVLVGSLSPLCALPDAP